ncbi:MAG: ABC transporter permease [Devosia sp.]
MSTLAADPPRYAIDKLGVVIALLGAIAALLPFAAYRANRIVPGVGEGIFTALPLGAATTLGLLYLVGLAFALLRTPPWLRLATASVVLAALLLALGLAATHLTPEGNTYARVAPGAGFWLALFAFALLFADTFAKLRLGPWMRIAALLIVAVLIAALLLSGAWNNVSVIKEYATRSADFWREGRTHVFLALGSLAAATVVGIPLGIAAHRNRTLRAPIINVLNAVQTIPSIALFGLLIAPLAYLASTLPFLRAIGVAGIGPAPAMIALFVYSLLPVVANTVVGLDNVPSAANEAARGLGMTDRQRLWRIEFPLAFPVILTGIRIVLVQNIGLATIAALIGGGGFGVYVFQGIGQTAMDLVLLGAIPTVAMAFAAAVVLDAAVELVSPKGKTT